MLFDTGGLFSLSAVNLLGGGHQPDMTDKTTRTSCLSKDLFVDLILFVLNVTKMLPLFSHHSPASVSDTSSMCWCGGSGSEPAGACGIPGLPVLLLQRDR